MLIRGQTALRSRYQREVVHVRKRKNRQTKIAASIMLRFLEIVTILLLLTGQITIGGVFITPDGFSLSLSGLFTGRRIVVGKTEQAKFIQDGLDVITALLLILGEINVIGTYITAGRFTIVVGGPPFGLDKIEAYVPETKEFFGDYEEMVIEKCNVYKFGKRE
jgi:hypothetical protein